MPQIWRDVIFSVYCKLLLFSSDSMKENSWKKKREKKEEEKRRKKEEEHLERFKINKITHCTNPLCFSEKRRCDSSDHINRVLTIVSIAYLLIYIDIIVTINGNGWNNVKLYCRLSTLSSASQYHSLLEAIKLMQVFCGKPYDGKRGVG